MNEHDSSQVEVVIQVKLDRSKHEKVKMYDSSHV